MKRYFFTGFVLLLPFTLTLIIVIFSINLLTAPFKQLVESSLDYYDLLDQPFLFLSKQQVLYMSSRIIILLFLLGIVLLIGYFGRMVLINALIHLGEKIIHRIPMINAIYKSIKEVIQSLFSSSSKAFSQVVLIPYPNSRTYSIALISSDNANNDHSPIMTVFLPTVLNPTMGYMLKVKRDELIYIDMKVEDALKCILSGGAIFPKSQLQPLTSEDLSIPPQNE